MNHSSILQIHLNGGESSLSGGEHSIRIFSLAAASPSASSLRLLSEGLPDQKAKSRLKQQVRRRLKGRRNLQVNWKAISDWGKKIEVSGDSLPKSPKSQDGVWEPVRNLLQACDGFIPRISLN